MRPKRVLARRAEGRTRRGAHADACETGTQRAERLTARGASSPAKPALHMPEPFCKRARVSVSGRWVEGRGTPQGHVVTLGRLGTRQDGNVRR